MKDFEYNEKKQHGSVAFPLQYYYVNNKYPEYIMPLHWHKEFEIIHIISGSIILYIDNKRYQVYKDEIAIVECNILHRGEPIDCIYECIVFDINMLRKHHNDVISKYIVPVSNNTVTIKRIYKKETSPEFINITKLLFKTIIEKKDYYELKIFSLLFEFFELIYENNKIKEYPQKHIHEKQLKIIMKLLDWIEVNYTEHITLCKLSEIAGINEKYLCKFFKEYTSKTPIDYINNLRVQSACYEISQNRLSITEAALESGFNDLSYFSKTFKKYMGMCPKEYMKNIY